ncbi:MAG: Crp/Fnr family transcriptional regulator [Epsilonproteobacteria bacterium]|nr:Crp/Fnr family transcriptional regulator [Campylobacterota bacterium]
MTLSTSIDKLKGLYLFSDLDNSELEQIVEYTQFKRYYKGNIIYYEQDLKKEIYYLQKGQVKVYKVDRFDNEVFLYNIYSDNLITKISNLNENIIRCFGNIECEVDCEVLIIDFEKFSNFCLQKPKILLTLIDIFSQKAMMLECLINRELVYDGVAKVAFTLVNEPHLFNQMTKKEIAYQLNIQPETLSRILKKLSRKELISVERSGVEVLDIEGLKVVYE